MSWRFVIAPLVGAAIGYITNDVAIRMLFHPGKAIYIDSFRLPFTPGLIPKEQKRIARSLGNAISYQLLDTKAVKAALLSGSMLNGISEKLDGIIDKLMSCDITAEEFVEKFLEKKKIHDIEVLASDKLASSIKKAVMDKNPGDMLCDAIMTYLADRLGFMKKLIPVLGENLKPYVTDMVNDFLDENMEQITKDIIKGKLEETEKAKLSDVISGDIINPVSIKRYIKNVYIRLVNEKTDSFLESVQINKIVENKVLEFDVAQLEQLIFGLMKRELKMIVYLGALLGFLMGFINLIKF